MSVLLTRAAELLVLPPAVNLLLAILGLALLRKKKRLGIALLALSLTTLYLFSIPATALWLMDSLQKDYPALTAADLQHPKAQAIVVLGAGRNYGAPEYGRDTASKFGLERLRYGAHLHRLTNLPILVTGGAPHGETSAEARIMKDVLVNDFRVAVKWVEDKSLTTFENARYSRPFLEQAHIRRVYLVTHAWHMPRSVLAFERAGIAVIPAPTGFVTPWPIERGAFAWLPSAHALQTSYHALHEIGGWMWYKLREPQIREAQTWFMMAKEYLDLAERHISTIKHA
ncbi:MAG: YdcF family protein [Pseudomonadota bacterium]